ncbi:MAG: hypothetical protein BI182_00695 [Acetobacterium sp. MES1]|uniref:hypothetical protein n=1 Tax=Acetobacterium sp. MES1 TaxID=1899015 RepID=UPI000B9D4CB5|nr:hypothetical protein [Acetobacterium sp. MES1]OXS25664.1 MAG: hypothetical protein BI182_00695 [Acetobacterium sp. MES1]
MKTLKHQITQLDGQIFRNTQYRRHYQNRLAQIDGDTEATARRCQNRIDRLTDQIEADQHQVERLQARMIDLIEGLGDRRIQEILTRRYVGNESFETIAAAMHYDLRWVYRLHQQGLRLINPLEAA